MLSTLGDPKSADSESAECPSSNVRIRSVKFVEREESRQPLLLLGIFRAHPASLEKEDISMVLVSASCPNPTEYITNLAKVISLAF